MNRPVSSTLKIPKDGLCQEVGAETILLDMHEELYFGLNSVGARIWQLLREGKEIEQVVAVLGQEFEVPEHQLWKDVDELLGTMMDKGLLKTK
jgi:hypothetical protein